MVTVINNIQGEPNIQFNIWKNMKNIYVCTSRECSQCFLVFTLAGRYRFSFQKRFPITFSNTIAQLIEKVKISWCRVMKTCRVQ